MLLDAVIIALASSASRQTSATLPEPTDLVVTLLRLGTLATPFLVYYAGLLLRYRLRRYVPTVIGEGAEDRIVSLGDQCLLGIPVALGIVTPLIPAFRLAVLGNDDLAILGSAAIFLHQGFAFNEAAARWLQNLGESWSAQRGSGPTTNDRN